MQIKKIRCVNFKSFEDRTFEFGRINYIMGDNYQGKTSISEAIVTLLLGTTLSGNPQVGDLIRIGEKKFELTGIVIDDGGEEHEIYRSRDSRKTTLQLDGNPATQADIDRIVGSKERFLTVFTPGYFAGLSNPAAREMIISLTRRPKAREVLDRMTAAQADRLMVRNNQQSIDDGQPERIPDPLLRDPGSFAEGVRKTIKANQTELNKLDGRLDVYREQLRQEAPNVPDFNSNRLDDLRKEIKEIADGEIQVQLNLLRFECTKIESIIRGIRFRDVPTAPYSDGDLCPVCGSHLTGQALDKALGHHMNQVEKIEDENAEMIVQQIELQEQLKTTQEKIREIEASMDRERIQKIRNEIEELERLEYDAKSAQARLEQHHQTIKSATENIAEIEKSKAEIETETFQLGEQLKAIAEYRQQLVKLQVESITEHLHRVGIKLFDVTKEGEVKDTFELTYDGKEYKVLSMSERIRVNLEIATLFNTVLDLDLPIFIDNGESITHYDEPFTRQIFIARVVEGSELKLEVEE